MMRILRIAILYFFIVLGLSHSTIWAQFHQFRFNHPSEDKVEGLSPTQNTSIALDDQGFVWLGNFYRGISRYDGLRAKEWRYDSADPHSLSSDEVVALAWDPRGALWVGTSVGLNRFDPVTEKVERFLHDPNDPSSLSHNRITSVQIGTDNMIWIGTGNGLNSFDYESKSFTSYLADDKDTNSLSNNVITNLLQTKDGTVWVGTENGLNRLDPKTGQFENYFHDPEDPASLSHNHVTSFLEMDNTGLWVGTAKGGLNLFDVANKRFETFKHKPEDPASLSGNHVTTLFQSHDQLLWVGTYENGLNIWLPEERTFQRLESNEDDSAAFHGSRIMGITEDSTGLLWVLAMHAGINVLDEKGSVFKPQMESKNGITLKNSIGHAISPDGSLWIVSHEDGLKHYFPDTQELIHYKHDPNNPNSLQGNSYHIVSLDSTGVVWLTSATKGLQSFNPKTKQFTAYLHDPNDPTSIDGNWTIEAFEDSKGRFWVSTTVGLNLMDRKTGTFQRVVDHSKEPSNVSNVMQIFEDKEERLWLATYFEGLKLFDPEQQTFKHFSHSPEALDTLSSNTLIFPFEDSKGRFWITSNKGLNLFDRETGKVRRFSTAEGFPSDYLCDILEDQEGNLWVGSADGVIRFNPNTGESHLYGEEVGIVSCTYYGSSQSTEGTMYFTNPEAPYFFNPAELEKNLIPPPVLLTGVRKFDIEIPPTGLGNTSPSHLKQLTLGYQDSFFGLEFAALDFAAPEANQYRYKLEGFDSDWIRPRQNYVTYTNLDAGQYTFRVKASNSDGTWNEEGLSLPITIVPPPWKTWWAYLIYIAVLLTIVARFFQTNRAKLVRQEKELERERQITEQLRENDRLKDHFLANTSHELRTPLNGIIGIVESLMDGATGPLSQLTKDNLAMVVQSGRRLANLVNDILDFSKMEHKDLQLQLQSIDLKSLFEIVLAISRPLIGNKPIVLKLQISDDLPLVRADENRLQQVLLNLVGNGIKFTHQGEVNVIAAQENGQVRVSISDTGIGIAKDQQERIFQSFEQADGSTAREYGGTGLGLAVSRQLVELHDGRLEVDSAEGEGATFSFTLPISKDQQVHEISPQVHQLDDSKSKDEIDESLPPLQPPPQNAVVVEDQPSEVKKQWTILMVDDEPVNLQVLKNQLSLHQYRTITADDGFQALEILESEVPDLILLDLMMPRMSGYEVCQKIRETHPAETLPIVLLTAKNQVADLIEGFDIGANDYLTKPFHKEELLARVESHIQLKEAAKAMEEGKRVEIELQTAQTMQELLIPKIDPQLEGIEIASFYQSASETGGDWYHYRHHEALNQLEVVIGDVTGHGVPAALITAMVSSLYSAEALEPKTGNILPSTELDDPKSTHFLNVLNDVLHHTTEGAYHMTFFYSVIDLEKKILTYASAAHNPCLIWRPTKFNFIQRGKEKQRSILDLKGWGQRLGYDADSSYEVKTQELQEDDVIVWFTDGLLENKNPEREQFGMKRLKKVLRQCEGLSADAIKDKIMNEANQHFDGYPFEDDLTLIVGVVK